MKMLNHTNKGGVMFIENSAGNVVERRYVQGNWEWKHHPILDGFLSELENPNIKSIGPLLCNDGVCRLYLVTESGVVSYHTEGDPPPQFGDRISMTEIKSSSNIAVDENWHLHTMDVSYNHNQSYKYDIMTSHPIDFGSLGSLYFDAPEQPIDGSVAIFDDKVGYIYFGKLYIAESLSANADKAHPFNRSSIDSILGVENSIFAIKSNNYITVRRGRKLYEIKKRTNIGLSEYDWEEHGRSDYTRKFLSNAPVSIGYNKFALLAQYKKSRDIFVLERYQDSSGNWHWADHGYPSIGQPEAIASPRENSDAFFIISNNHLIQRHFSGGSWAWEDHGQIPV